MDRFHGKAVETFRFCYLSGLEVHVTAFVSFYKAYVCVYV